MTRPRSWVLTAPYEDIWEAWDDLTDDQRRAVSKRIGRETKVAMEFYNESMKVAAAALQRFAREYAAAMVRDPFDGNFDGNPTN